MNNSVPLQIYSLFVIRYKYFLNFRFCKTAMNVPLECVVKFVEVITKIFTIKPSDIRVEFIFLIFINVLSLILSRYCL